MDKEKTAVAYPAVEFTEFTPTSYEAWKEQATASLKGAPFEKKLLTKTYEGITLEPLYTPRHAESFGPKDGYPGLPDYLRGTSAAGYLDQLWTIAQANCATDPADAGRILANELAKGASAIAFDAEQLNLQTLADLESLLNAVDVRSYPLQAWAGASAVPLLGLLSVYLKKVGIDAKDVCGVVGADPLAALAVEGQLPAGLDGYYEQMAAAIRWVKQELPGLRTISIQGAVYHNGGASAVQELAAVMASAIAYLDALTERGLSIDEAAQQIEVDFSLGANFFMEIAKIRAARVIWAQIIKAFGGSEESARLHITAHTSRFTNTVYDPYVNILRATTQAFSGVVGGLEGLSVGTFDAAVRCSDEQSRRIARNIQIMLQNEFNVLAPVDPAGGSWYVETLTGQLAEAAWGLVQEIEKAGGMLAALQSGFVQDAIAGTLAERFKKLSTRADVAVGSNMYANMQETPLTGQKCAPAACSCGCGQAPNEAVTAALGQLNDCVSSVEEAVRQGASVSQLQKALNKGEAVQVKAIEPHRWTEQYEALRQRTEAHIAKTGRNIRIFLANMGPIPQHKARADFSTGFMEVGGFEVLRNDGFATVAEAAAAAQEAQAQVTVICSTDATYPEIVPELAAAIKKASPNMLVLLAGAPAAEHKDSYVAAGVDDFIHVKANCLEILTKIQNAGGMVE